MTSNELTLLCDPIITPRDFAATTARWIGRHLRTALAPPPSYMRSRYRGHFAVTRSFVEGLQAIGVRANYAPVGTVNLSRRVVVLSGIATLRQAIRLKAEGRIDRLVAGPNILEFPSEQAELISAPEVDVCITPAPVTCRLYETDCPALAGRCQSCPAGVNTRYWSPSTERSSRRVLVYEKSSAGAIPAIAAYCDYLQSLDYEVEVIRYGSYMPDQYRALLRDCSLMIGFSAMESQGIAWAEAWSCDVPTLIWSQTELTLERERGAVICNVSTAPYLTEATGAFFTSFESFQDALRRWEVMRDGFAARQWVLENMSDEVCARTLCSLAGVSPPMPGDAT